MWVVDDRSQFKYQCFVLFSETKVRLPDPKVSVFRILNHYRVYFSDFQPRIPIQSPEILWGISALNKVSGICVSKYKKLCPVWTERVFKKLVCPDPVSSSRQSDTSFTGDVWNNGDLIFIRYQRGQRKRQLLVEIYVSFTYSLCQTRRGDEETKGFIKRSIFSFR